MDEEMWREGDVEMEEKVLPLRKNLIKSVKELAVFKRSYNFSLVIHRKSLQFPKIEQYALADQLRRSSKSVCANIAEGFARQSGSKLEFKRFLTIAIGSANETQLWVSYAFDLEYIDNAAFQLWMKECDAIIGMLVNLRNKL